MVTMMVTIMMMGDAVSFRAFYLCQDARSSEAFTTVNFCPSIAPQERAHNDHIIVVIISIVIVSRSKGALSASPYNKLCIGQQFLGWSESYEGFSAYFMTHQQICLRPRGSL